MKLALVALPVPVHRAFTYAVRSDHESTAKEGARVICSFGNRLALGVIVRAYEGDPPPKIKSIERVLPGALPIELMSFLTELSRYYFAPIGEAMKLALPPIEKETTRALREPSLFEEPAKGVGPRKVQWVRANDAPSDAATLTPKQARVLSQIVFEKECTVASLEEKIPGARAVANRLSAMGLVASEVRDAPSDPFFDSIIAKDSPPTLTDEQARADEAIGVALTRELAATFLLSGVTGSGKTEVYLRAIERAKQLKKGSILLVPEIALTPQLVSRFRARFGDDVGVIHSGLSAKERHAMWMRLRSGEVNVAIGARSAVFAPVENLGLVIVDEEHDPSFKQEEGVRYHARDMAILRAHRVHGTCILGSATPSLESELLVRTNKAERLRLTQRAHKDAVLPTVEIIDLRRTPPGPTGDRRISLPLHRALEKTLNAAEQAILFL